MSVVSLLLKAFSVAIESGQVLPVPTSGLCSLRIWNWEKHDFYVIWNCTI
jgi:hypothetical protein